MRRTCLAVMLVLAGFAAACSNLGEDRLLSVSTTGTVNGLVYFDLNGNRSPDQGDDSVRNLRVKLVHKTTGDSVAGTITPISGIYTFNNVPVGTYRLVVNTAPLSDTAIVDRIDSADVNVRPGDTTAVNIVISYPRVSIAAARLLAIGKKVFVEGVILNALNTFRDTTMHVQDTSAAIRATRVFATAAGPADSVRLRGTISRRPVGGAGQPTLDLVTIFSTGAGVIPTAATITTGVAFSAQNGVLDARLVRVLDAPITDTATVGPDFRMTVNDGSGALEVLLDATAAPPAATYIPGNRFDIVGLLVPTGVAGVWRLKPRSFQDLVRR